MYRLLIVDDNFSDREGLKDLVNWKSLGIDEVYLAKNGMEGLKKALELNPALVLTDVSMPIMNGLVMAENISKALPDTKFIFMSCFDDVEYIRTAIDVNAYGYLLKPINIGKLNKTVEKVLKIKKIQQDRDNELSEMQEQIKESMPILQEQVARDLLYGNFDIIEKLDKVGMQLEKMYSVALVQIDNYNNLCEENDIDKNYFMIHRVKQAILPEQNKRVFSFIQNRKTLAVIIYLDNISGAEEGLNETLLYLDTVKDSVNEQLNVNITVCIGGVSGSLSDAGMMYNKAEYAIGANMYSQGNNIILAEELSGSDAMLSYNIDELKNEITKLVERENSADIDEFANKYFMMNEVYPKNTLKGFSFTIISILQMVLIETGENFENIFGDENAIWNKLSNFETIVDIHQWFVNIFKSVIQYLEIKNQSKDRYSQIVDNIKEIIGDNYGEIGNISQVTDRLYISANHANFIFKEKTGMTIFDYLIRVRMEEAKKLLQNFQYKVYEVSEKVGYQSKTYFTAVFKEYTGFTPKEYRDRASLGSEKRGLL